MISRGTLVYWVRAEVEHDLKIFEAQLKILHHSAGFELSANGIDRFLPNPLFLDIFPFFLHSLITNLLTIPRQIDVRGSKPWALSKSGFDGPSNYFTV